MLRLVLICDLLRGNPVPLQYTMDFSLCQEENESKLKKALKSFVARPMRVLLSFITQPPKNDPTAKIERLSACLACLIHSPMKSQEKKGKGAFGVRGLSFYFNFILLYLNALWLLIA